MSGDINVTHKKEVENRPSKLDRSGRPKRQGLHGKKNILGVQGLEEGWHYAWVHEEDVDKFTEAWYEFVTHDVIVADRKVNAASQVGGRISKAVGNGVTDYLMRVPEELFQEDQRALDEETNATEIALKERLTQSSDYGDVSIHQTTPGNRKVRISRG